LQRVGEGCGGEQRVLNVTATIEVRHEELEQ
jgi:hypothetical protein